MSQVGLRMSEETVHRRSRRRTGIAVLAALLLIGGLLGAGYLGVGKVYERLSSSAGQAEQDYPGPGSGEVVFEVRPGDTAKEIAQGLEKAGVVASAASFLAAAQADNERASRLQPGFYRLREKMSGAGAFALILDPATRAEARVTVPEGLRLGETLRVLAKGTGIAVADYQKAIKAGNFGLPAYAKGNPEGFLFPATYDVPPDAKAVDVLRLMTKRFDQAAKESGASGAGKFSPYETVIIASLVEAEAKLAKDYPRVARVVDNRLDQKISLRFDSTINYALNKRKYAPTTQDLKIDSPYNTYTHQGLPPGPINSPGEQALAAAAKPEPGDWLYFVTTNPESGETKFTSSYEEFLTFKREYQRNSGKG